jgi:superfamily I DNA/RNA helicase
MELALPLLEDIAPDVAPPIAYRTGAAPPEVRRVDEAHLLVEAFRSAANAPEGLAAVILPEELADNVPSGELVPVLTPREAKGLEFDHVVVVEPALIPPRDLYVALTRPTKTLVVLHARDLPSRLAVRR